MNIEEEKIILPTDDGIVEWKSVEGWVGKDNRFYGKDENLARYANSTHRVCDKGHVVDKLSYCKKCALKKAEKSWADMPFKEWDKKTPLCLFDSDTYFFDEDSVHDYLEEEELQPGEARFVICEPNFLSEIDVYGQWEEVIPEDWTIEDCSKEVSDKLDELNKLIQNLGPVSWTGGKYKTTIQPYKP